MSESKKSRIITKGSKGYGYTYASLADIYGAGFEGPKVKTVTEPDGRDFMYYWDEDFKEWIRGAEIVIPEGKGMNKAQLMGSALSYSYRYTTILYNRLATSDDEIIENIDEKGEKKSEKKKVTDKQIEDARAQMFATDPECATEAQITYLRRLYTPEEIIKVCARNKWQDITKIPFDKAKTMIEVRNK